MTGREVQVSIYRATIIGLAASAAMLASASAQTLQTAADRAEVLHLIRREKLDLVLPGAMGDNDVDMWIHVVRDGDPDPLAAHFGPAYGYLVFTRSGDRVERALFGGGGHPDFFDHFGSREIAMAVEGYGYPDIDFSVYDELYEYVAARDPRTIAVNSSPWLAIADGISHSEYTKLERILRPDYAARIVSAENLITDFRVRRTAREIGAFVEALELHRQVLERALSREVITPGATTLRDVGEWVREEFARRGLVRGHEMGVSIPRILYSAVSEPIDPPDVRWWIHHDDYVIRRGDFMTFDVSVRYLDYFATDYKRNAYVLREGEESVPESIQRAYDRAIAAREIMRPEIRAGRTAGEVLAAAATAMEREGYVYTPFNDIGTEDYVRVQRALADTDAPGFSIDFHSQGNNGGSLVTLGPSVAPFRTDRAHLVIQPNHFFSFEYMVHSNLPGRPGFPISINIEGNHIVTERGVEYLHPPNERILIIR